MVCVSATLASCTSSALDNADWGIWSYSETSDACQISEIVRSYNTSGEFRRGTAGLGALLKRGEDAILTQMYRDGDKHLLRYIISSNSFSARPGCNSEFEIERSINGSRDCWKTTYSCFKTLMVVSVEKGISLIG